MYNIVRGGKCCIGRQVEGYIRSKANEIKIKKDINYNFSNVCVC